MSSVDKVPLAFLPEFDYYKSLPVSYQIEDDYFNEIRPLNAINQNQAIEFLFDYSYGEFLSLHNSYVYIKYKVKIDNAVGSVDWGKIDPVNNLFHCLFEDVEFSYNGKILTSSLKTDPYASYFSTLIDYNLISKKSFLQSQFWWNDSKDKFLTISSIRNSKIKPTLAAGGTTNESGELDLMGMFHIDLAHQTLSLPGPSKIHIKIHLKKNEFLFRSELANSNPKIEITECCFYPYMQKGTDEFVKGLSEVMEKKPLNIEINRREVKHFIIPNNTTNINIDNAIVSMKLPRYMLIGFVQKNAFNGDYSLNPFNFETCHLNYLACYVNGKLRPQKPYKPDYSKGLYKREYLSLYQTLHQNVNDNNLGITLENYANGFCFYGIDLSKDKSSGCGSGHKNLAEGGNIRFEIRFSTPLANTMAMIIFTEYDNVIQIIHPNEVITDYN